MTRSFFRVIYYGIDMWLDIYLRGITAIFGMFKAFLDQSLMCHLGALICGLGLTLAIMLLVLEIIQ